MRKTALLELIRNGYNSKIVFQSDTIQSGAFAKEIVALLNLQAERHGSIFLGGARGVGPCQWTGLGHNRG